MKPIDRFLQVATQPVAGAAVSAGTFVPFPDVPELRSGVLIYGIEAYTAADQSVSPSGFVPLISLADSLLATVVLQESSTQRVQWIPYRSLVASQNSGIWKEFTPFLVNWQASGVYFTGIPAAPTQFVGALGVMYSRISGGAVVQPPRPVRRPVTNPVRTRGGRR